MTASGRPPLLAGAMMLALTGVALLPVPAQGQEHLADVDPGAGLVLPTGDLADLFDPGFAAEIGVSRRISGPVRAAIDFDVGVLSGKEGDLVEIPDLRLWSFTGGLELDLLDRSSSVWRITPEVTAGIVRFDSDELTDGGSGGFSQDDLSETYFTATGGVRLGRSVSDHVGVFVGGTAQLLFADEVDTAVFRQLSPDLPAFGTTVAVPVTAGVRVQF